MVESHLHFKLNGRIHGNNVFQRDLDFALNGKKIVKSIQNRLNSYANYLFKARRGGASSGSEKFEAFRGKVKLTKKQFYVKIINISQSFGIKIEVDSSCASESRSIFKANFNKIVKAGIKIKGLIFSFAIPNHQFIIDESQISMPESMPLGRVLSEQENIVSNLELLHSRSVNNQAPLEVEKRIVTK